MRAPFAVTACAVALTGCGLASLPAPTVPAAIVLEPRPVPVLAARDLDDGGFAGEAGDGAAGEFPSGWGMRVGMTTYFGENTNDVPARPLLGGYYHFNEEDWSRLELAIELAPDFSNLGDNRYFLVSGRYVRFLGEAGSAFWKAGGGGILELRGGDTGFFGLVEAGGGAWLGLGEKKGLVIGAALQMPLGSGLNAPAVVALQVGLEMF